MQIVEARGFTFTYAGSLAPALSELSFAVEPGETVGLAGPMAAGKSTLCMALAGFAPRVVGGTSQGELAVLGSSPAEALPAARGKVGMVFEDYEGQLIQLRVIEEVLAPLLNQGLSDSAALTRARRALQAVGLSNGVSDKWVWEITGGQQQMLAVAATLALNPELLLLDNVARKLDASTERCLQKVLGNLRRKKTVLAVDKRATFFSECVDRLLILDSGELVAFGPPDELLRDHALLDRADLEPPVSMRLARALGSRALPLTPDEFCAQVPTLQSTRSKRPGGAPEAAALGPVLARADNLAFNYPNGCRALEGLNLELHQGEVHAIIGMSGAGKSTLIKQLCGLLKPTRGSVMIMGVDTRRTSPSALSERVGTVLYNADDQLSERTVDAELSFGLRRRQIERTGWFSGRPRYAESFIQERTQRAVEDTGMPHELLSCDPILLSRGQRKLVAIASAVAGDPWLLLLDEPTVGLGARAREQVRQLIARLKQRGKLVVIVEHDLDFVGEVSDQLSLLHEGRVLAQGTPYDILGPSGWPRLRELDLAPPAAAEFACRLGVQAINFHQLASSLRLLHEG